MHISFSSLFSDDSNIRRKKIQNHRGTHMGDTPKKRFNNHSMIGSYRRYNNFTNANNYSNVYITTNTNIIHTSFNNNSLLAADYNISNLNNNSNSIDWPSNLSTSLLNRNVKSAAPNNLVRLNYCD